MNKIVGIHQPNLMPHLGLIRKWMDSDKFVILTEVDMNYRDYIHRSKLLGGWGTLEVTRDKKISEVRIKNVSKLYNAIVGKYGTAGAWVFDEVFDSFKAGDSLVEFNLATWYVVIHHYLGSAGVKKFKNSLVTDSVLLDTQELEDYYHSVGGSQKMALLTELAGGNVYLSGNGGKNYIQPQHFIEKDLVLTYQPPIQDPMNLLGYGAPHYLTKDQDQVTENYLQWK